MKKTISKILLSIMVCVAGITLFACGGTNVGKEDCYKAVATLVEDINKDNQKYKMFSTATVDGVPSDYALTYFIDKEDNKFLNQSIIVPFNFISTYYSDLQSIKDFKTITSQQQTALNELANAVPALKNAYFDSVDKYTRLKSVSSSVTVEEGALHVFKQSVKSLLKTSYDVALKLANVKNVVLNDYQSLVETSQALTAKDTRVLRDYFVLEVFNDFYKFHIENLNMEDFTKLNGNAEVTSFKNLVITLRNRQTKVLSVQAISEGDMIALTGEKVTEKVDGKDVEKYKNTKVEELFEMASAMANERKMLNKALDNFSFYDYYFKYSCSMDAYKAKLEFAEEYGNKITSYYGYCVDYTNSMKQKII